ncbi:MAG: hypothetical protein E6Q97_29295 [Desulfurellales bacterium]|nr:MAG: hypothetical protein E6Q97_29295 [Desulfurellales bacterium]
MRINPDPNLPTNAPSEWLARLSIVLKDRLSVIANQLNNVSSGRAVAYDLFSAAPTAGTWQQGDYVKNSAPVEAGIVGSKYVIKGWICVSAGTPGTWVDDRALTGN